MTTAILDERGRPPTVRARSMSTIEQRLAERRRQRWLRGGAFGFLAAIVGAVILSAVFQASGGRFFIVESPSMGQTAPVGSLVIDRPATTAQLRTGDIITFHPPTAPNGVYTHRIAAITPEGYITTRGDINGAEDGWLLTKKDLIGRVTQIVPGAGWLIRAVPYLLLGGVAVWVVSRSARTSARRAAYRIAGYSLVVSITAIILRPFVGIRLLAATADRDGAHATFVSTGMLPIRVSAVDGTFVDLVSGQVGRMNLSATATDAHYTLSSIPNLSVLGWVIFFLVCAIPLLWILIVGLPPRTHEEAL